MTCARPFGALPSKMFEVLAVALMATLAGVAFGFFGLGRRRNGLRVNYVNVITTIARRAGVRVAHR